jgi:hypothetical protein
MNCSRLTPAKENRPRTDSGTDARAPGGTGADSESSKPEDGATGLVNVWLVVCTGESGAETTPGTGGVGRDGTAGGSGTCTGRLHGATEGVVSGST